MSIILFIPVASCLPKAPKSYVLKKVFTPAIIRFIPSPKTRPISLKFIFFVRPFAIKFLHAKNRERLSNADAIIGRIGRVSQAVEAGGYGRVAIDGDDWKAESIDGMPIEKGCNVKVISRESIIITVERV